MAPLPLGRLSGTVLHETVYVHVQGSEPGPDVRSAFVAYHVREDRWVELESPPVPDGTALALVAAGDKVVAIHPSQEHAVSPDLIYDPATDDWTELPLDPLAPSFDRAAVWTGREILLLGVELVPNPGSVLPSLYRAVGLDPAVGTWWRLPDSEVLGWDPVWFWVQGRLINPTIGRADGGQVNNWGRDFAFGGIFDSGRGAWSPLPEAAAVANVYQGISAAGPDHVVSSAGFVLHVPTMTWVPLVRPGAGIETGAGSAWAGDRLFLWGGIRTLGAASALHGDGWTWQP